MLNHRQDPGLRACAIGLALVLLAGWSTAQGSIPPVKAAPRSFLGAFDVSAGTVQELRLPTRGGAAFNVDVVLDGAPRTLLFRPYDVRANNFRLLIQDERGVYPVPTPDSVTYRGEVIGAPESVAAASLVDGRLTAMIRLKPGATLWAVQPLHGIKFGIPDTSHIVFASRDNLKLDFRCGTPDGPVGTPGGAELALSNKVAEIAIDADYPFFLKNGSSVSQTQNDVTTVINVVDTIYKRDVQIEYKITSILVRSTPDPYTSTDASTLLSQFRNQWNTFHGNIPRDLAHLFTGRNLNGGTIGLAFVGVICNIPNAYGLSESRFTSNLTYRAGLTAHEVGHNWSAPHCSGSACNIMCATLGGCSRNVSSFSSQSISYILNHKNSRTCLHDPLKIPSITAIAPNSVPAFNPGNVLLTGTDFDQVSSLHVGSTVLNPFQFKIISSTKIEFTPPPPSQLGLAFVRVSNAAGSSNSVILTYNITQPPALTANTVGVGGQPFPWSFGGDPGDLWFLLIALNNGSTFKFMGHDVLASGVPIASGALNGAGLGSFQLVPPRGPLVGSRVYSQIALISDTTFQFVGTTNITQTAFVLD